MKKEHLLAIIVGLFILSYVLDAVVNPLPIDLISPYHYFTPPVISTYPFTTVSIAMKGIALLLTPLLLFSLLEISYTGRATTLLILSGLLQLYSLQDIVSQSYIVPLEWSLSFTLTGLLMIPPLIYFFFTASLHKVRQDVQGELDSSSDSPPDKLQPLDK